MGHPHHLLLTALPPCVDGSHLARVDLTSMQGGRVLPCVRPIDAAHGRRPYCDPRERVPISSTCSRHLGASGFSRLSRFSARKYRQRNNFQPDNICSGWHVGPKTDRRTDFELARMFSSPGKKGPERVDRPTGRSAAWSNFPATHDIRIRVRLHGPNDCYWLFASVSTAARNVRFTPAPGLLTFNT